jgi:hypothetical protein
MLINDRLKGGNSNSGLDGFCCSARTTYGCHQPQLSDLEGKGLIVAIGRFTLARQNEPKSTATFCPKTHFHEL